MCKLDSETAEEPRSNCQHPLDHRKSKGIPEKHLLLLHWLRETLWLHESWPFSGGASGKEPACKCRRSKIQNFNLWVGKITWSRRWQFTPLLLRGEFHGQRSLAGYSPQGHKDQTCLKQLRIDSVDHNKIWKILKELGIPEHFTFLLRNLYTGQEATIRTRHRTTGWFQTGKGVHQGCILSPCLFNLCRLPECSVALVLSSSLWPYGL